jgi:hypothetical protein
LLEAQHGFELRHPRRVLENELHFSLPWPTLLSFSEMGRRHCCGSATYFYPHWAGGWWIGWSWVGRGGQHVKKRRRSVTQQVVSNLSKSEGRRPSHLMSGVFRLELS